MTRWSLGPTLGSEREASFHVLGLDCQRCARHAEEALQGTVGVISARVCHAGELAQVTYDARRTSEAELVAVMGRAGYGVCRVVGLAPSTRAGTGLGRVLLAVGLLLGQLALSTFDVGPELLRAGIATAVLVVAGGPAARLALRRARDGSVGRDALVIVAALIVFALGWAGLRGDPALTAWRGFDSSSVVVVFALVERAVYAALWAHALEDLARDERARLSVVTRVDPEGDVRTVARDALRVGDRVCLPAGSVAPADVQLESEARVVEPGAAASAETAPRPLGAPVRSGSLVLDDAVARVRRPSCSPITSTFDAETHRVLAGLLREGGRSSSGVAEVVAQATIIAAAAFALFAFAVRVGAGASALSPAPWFFAVAVLAAASPAPFALALALARAAIVVRARALGVVIRDPAALGPLAGVTVACFAKTGTVTTADLRVAGVVWRGGVEAEGVLADVLAVESASRHPSGRAIVSYLRASGVDSAPLDGQVLEGRGVISGQVRGARVTIGASRALASAGAPEAPLGASVAWFVQRGVRQGYFVLIDTLREGVGAVFRSLWQRSVPCRILSGDRREATRVLAHRLGVPGLGGLSLVDKALVVRDLQHGGARVLFVGRGEGGASPCPHADVAITVSDTLPRTSDPAPIVFTEERLDALPWLIDASRALRRTTRWVFGIGAAFNAVLIPAAVVGLLHPVAAASLALIEGLLTMGIAAVRIFRPVISVDRPR